MTQAFEAYLLKIKNTDIDDQTEHTSRSALETLLREFAAKGQGIKVQHEPRRTEGKGAPDYRITSKGMILGYVEVKAIGENLDKVLKSDQIAKYKTLSTNIILTDYLQFIWLSEKGVQARVHLATQTDLEARKFQIKPENADELTKLLDGFFSTRRKVLALLRNWRSLWLAVRDCCVTISVRNSCAKSASIRRDGYSACSKCSKAKSFTT